MIMKRYHTLIISYAQQWILYFCTCTMELIFLLDLKKEKIISKYIEIIATDINI